MVDIIILMQIKKGNENRYWPKVDREGVDECWPWLASKNRKGYGIFNVEDATSSTGMRAVPAHRFTWETENGPIPPGMFVDHTCFNRSCQNPRHLRLLTPQESGQRANKVPQDACRRGGHPYLPDNVFYTRTGARVCRTCYRERGRENMRRYRAQAS